MNLGIMTSFGKGANELVRGVSEAVQTQFIENTKINFVFTDAPEEVSLETYGYLDKANIPVIGEPSWFLRDVIKNGTGEEAGRERFKFDQKVHTKISEMGIPDFIILIGYMLKVSPWLCKKLLMLNLHPDIPGRYRGTWKKVVKRIIEDGSRFTGAMVHLVSRELDGGQPVTYFRYMLDGPEFEELWLCPRKKTWLAEKIRQVEFERELPLLIYTLKFLADEEIIIDQGKVLAIDRNSFCQGLFEVRDGYNLEPYIEHALTLRKAL